VCSFIGAQAMVDTEKHGGRNPLVDAAQAISITGEPDEAERQLSLIRGEKVADRLEDDPRLDLKVAADPEHGVEADNTSGSYEALMQMFAGPPPMPGRGG
jgi:hypothetical protein